jgi:radical SAM protein with 4Fe4S-binding SPASM domain
MSLYQDFRESLQDKTEVAGIPLHGQFELTFRCNLNCLHCYIAEDAEKRELSYSEIVRILDEIQEAGCLWLTVTGGEPLLRDDFLDIYAYIKKKGFLVNIFTNGALITPEIADYLEEYAPHMIEVTLHGITEEVYEGITRVKGSFRKCMEGIQIVLKRNLPLTLKTVGMTLNRNQISKIKEYVEGLGKVEYRFDSIIVPKLNGSKEPCKLRLSAEEIIAIEYSDKDMKQEWKACLERGCDWWEPEMLFRCKEGLFNINPYGELQFCYSMRDANYDLRQGTFKKGFSYLVAKNNSARFKTNSACKDCKIWSLCATCPGRAWLETGNPEEPVDFFCQLAKKRESAKHLLYEK